MDRRSFLASSLAGGYLLRPVSTAPGARLLVDGARPLWFKPIPASDADELALPAGYRGDIVATYGDRLEEGERDGQPLTFGYNNDFVAFLPIDARDGKHSSERGLLFVNHEYNGPLLQHGVADPRLTSKAQVQLEMQTVGCSIFEIERRDGRWHRVESSRFTQRFTALGPAIEMSGPAAGSKEAHGRSKARGTLANCSGGVTPWHTVTTCEENYQHAYGFGDRPFIGTNGWHRFFSGFPTDYGWVVEIDPFGELPPRKRTALGRFAHENCAFATTDDGRLVVYTADDRADQCVYKFVSSWKLTGDRKKDHAHALDEGVLHVADFVRGVWQRLHFDDAPDGWRKAGFASQADILVRTRAAAKAVGGTPMDRGECVVVHPETNEVFLAFTKNHLHGNHYGMIAWLHEQDGKPDARAFEYGPLASGGSAADGFACPDNLLLDRSHGMWMTSDISGEFLNRGVHRRRGNNSLFFVETRGARRGDCHRFANAPRGAEFTGPAFTPDESTLFLAVQHPGEMSASLDELESHWPHGGDAVPLPALVAITRDGGGPVTS